MASSSVSQEDLEAEFDLASRRSKIRSARARNLPINRAPPPATLIGDAAVHSECVGEDELTYIVERENALETSTHDGASPKPVARSKYKPNRPNHLKAKQKDRRKLREKRRSTGVILPTESTGGSTGEDDDDFLSAVESKKSAIQKDCFDIKSYESSLCSTSLQSKEHDTVFTSRKHKSPSDRDADNEDNEDFDNQSDSIFSLSEEPSNKDLTLKLTATTAANGRPHTPSTENVEDLLEHAQAENNRLLDLLEQKDKKINQLAKEFEIMKLENEKLKNENMAMKNIADNVSNGKRT